MWSLLPDSQAPPCTQTYTGRAAPSRDLVQIVPTRFGAESGMLGAAVLALDGIAASEAP